MRCPECSGNGESYTTIKGVSQWVDCDACDGSGEVEGEDEDDEGSDDCPTCGGCGGGEFSCSRCHGSGRNLDRERERREDYDADQWDVKEDR